MRPLYEVISVCVDTKYYIGILDSGVAETSRLHGYPIRKGFTWLVWEMVKLPSSYIAPYILSFIKWFNTSN